jgi:hypothetical protein
MIASIRHSWVSLAGRRTLRWVPDIGLFGGEMKTGEEALPHPSRSRDFMPSLSRFTLPKLPADMAASDDKQKIVARIALRSIRTTHPPIRCA